MASHCCSELNDPKQQNIFKTFEKEYYKTILVRHSLDMIDEEKENFKEIERRASELEALAKLCDEEECTKLALAYMVNSTLLRQRKLSERENTSSASAKARQDQIQSLFAKAGAETYDRNMDRVRSQQSKENSLTPSAAAMTRKRTSILKTTPFEESFDGEREQKKVHFSHFMPKYTEEKRARRIRKTLLFAFWTVVVQFLVPLFVSAQFAPILSQIKLTLIVFGILLAIR